jgi:3-oxoacyl-[acyl-carrier-protein] synthase II
MSEVWVTGISLSSALGPTLPQGWTVLLQGKSGISLQQPFLDLPPYPLGLVSDRPTHLNDLLDIALQDVLEDAQLSPSPKTAWGVSVGSSRGYQAELEALAHRWHRHRTNPSASEWIMSYGQSPATRVAQRLQVCGPIVSPRAACATGLWAIAQGAELIRTGQCDVVVAGAVEAPITPLTLAGFEQMGALAHDGAYPFDQKRSGFVLGEGVGLMILERRDRAEKRGARPYGQVLGFGLTCDANHISSPAPDRRGAIAAIRDCLQRSHLEAAQVDFIHAHGTGTRLNDQAEAEMIRSLFSTNVAVSSTKGATGHTLGASGAMGSIFCLMALHHQILPPCVGLQNSAYSLNLIRKAQSASMQVAICFSFGFGGQNAALAFARPTVT